MYRKPNGKLSFSFGLFATNAVPNFANDSASDADISPQQKDDLFTYQCSLPEPCFLNKNSFYIAGIGNNVAESNGILTSLQKASILSPHPGDPTVYTDRITKHFSNQFPLLPIHRQRKLVSLLFFWEEELMRWKVCKEKEHEINKVLRAMSEADEAKKEEFKLVLSQMRIQWGMKPSLRTLGEGEQRSGVLPRYQKESDTLDLSHT